MSFNINLMYGQISFLVHSGVSIAQTAKMNKNFVTTVINKDGENDCPQEHERSKNERRCKEKKYLFHKDRPFFYSTWYKYVKKTVFSQSRSQPTETWKKLTERKRCPSFNFSRILELFCSIAHQSWH